MPDAAQFTMNLFDSTAIGWTLHPPVSEPAPTAPAPDPDDDDIRRAEKAPARAPAVRGTNHYLDGDRALARGWPARARDNLAAIRLSRELEASGRVPTRDEQARLLRFIGFGATDLAQNCFPRPGTTTFRDGWEETGHAPFPRDRPHAPAVYRERVDANQI